MFYIKSKCEDDVKIRERQTAICLNEEDLHLIDDRTEVFEIDYETYFSKQVLEQLEEFKLIENVDNLLQQYESLVS